MPFLRGDQIFYGKDAVESGKNSTFAEILKTNYLINKDETASTKLAFRDNFVMLHYGIGTGKDIGVSWC